MVNRKFPIGIQTFENIRTENYLYVDKTELIYKLAHDGKVYFLSRPRRFGKSLLVTTLKSYFEGRKDLFEGLAIDKLENEWVKYPVLHFDMSTAKYNDITTLKNVLNFKLQQYEEEYNTHIEETTPSVRLTNLIYKAHEQTKQKVVVLIDEYDAPLLDSLVDNESFATMRNIMRDFYSPLKACDAHLKFVFLTGIKKFNQLSIFSELNNLNNISMDNEYASICGINEEELYANFEIEIERIANKLNITYQESCNALKKKYNGYHFTHNSPDIYNPFSLINALSKANLNNYWFNTGTPTVLTQLVKKYNLKSEDFDKNFDASEAMFNVPTETATDAIPMLYQSGYLTIKDFEENGEIYKLGFPNDEVRFGFLRCLMPYYAHTIVSENETFLIRLGRLLSSENLDEAMQELRSFFASIPYNAEKQDENHYKTVFYLVFRLVTPYVTKTEACTAAGRSDVVVETNGAVYVFEFKLDGSAEDALKQIDEKGYMIPYEVTKKADGTPKTLYKIGANFNMKTKTIEKWIIINNL